MTRHTRTQNTPISDDGGGGGGGCGQLFVGKPTDGYIRQLDNNCFKQQLKQWTAHRLLQFGQITTQVSVRSCTSIHLMNFLYSLYLSLCVCVCVVECVVLKVLRFQQGD